MAHPHHDTARKAHGRKLQAMTGKRGEYPQDRAERIADVKDTHDRAQDERTHQVEEQYVGAPARQVSNLGNVRGK